jgi:hypothetical protein
MAGTSHYYPMLRVLRMAEPAMQPNFATITLNFTPVHFVRNGLRLQLISLRY